MPKMSGPTIIDGEVVNSELLPPAVPDTVVFTLTCNTCQYAQQMTPRVLQEQDGWLRCPGCGAYAMVPGNLMNMLPMIRDLAGKGQLEAWMKEHAAEFGWLRGLLGA